MHFSLVPYSNYCTKRDLEDRNSCCLGEGIVSDGRGRDFTKTRSDVWRHIFPSSWRSVLTRRSCYLVLSFIWWGGCICPSWGALWALSVLESVHAFNQRVLAKCASWVLIVPAQGDSHILHIVAFECLLTTLFTPKHLWKEHSTITKLEK